ncbi:MAG TPA: MFS transporter [Motilibacterales bacterium]|nr:MFS transporter [Motilibacterales bacterium]
MSTQPGLLPGALEEPTVPVRRGFITAVVLANLGIMLAFYTPIQNLLPRLAQDVAPDSKEAALAWITGAGAFASIIFNPLAGALSDRTTARWGRRKPWVLLGALVGAMAILALGLPGTVLGLALIWFLAQMSVNAAYAGLTATVPDQVPVRQRGLVSGWVGLAQTLGVVLGVAIVSFVVTDLRAGLVVTAVLLVVLVMPFVLGARDIPLRRENQPAFSLGQWLRGFWISPRLYPDFAWAWLTRFLMMLGNAMATLYLLFWLQDEVGYAEPEQGQTVLIALYAFGTMLTAVVFGAMSDRSGRRKIYVISATGIMAVAAVILAFFPVFPAAMLAALILGLGYGMYLGVDQALVTQVLPRAIDRGRDLGVINIANSAPQVLAPVIAAPIVTGAGGYTSLYLLTAVITLLSAVLVTRIRSVP